MAHVLIYRSDGKFAARVNRGLRAAELHTFDTREEVEKFAQESAGQTGHVRSELDLTDDFLARREEANRRAYNG